MLPRGCTARKAPTPAHPSFICCGSQVTSPGKNQMSSTAPHMSRKLGIAWRAIQVICRPVGFNLFVLQSLTRRDIGFVSRVAFPFFLMLLLFVVFPRLAPLWSLPQNTAAAKTGPGDTMAPGDVARLGASSELAFRVTFSGPVPPQRELYWRGLVFSEFDGREWRLG